MDEKSIKKKGTRFHPKMKVLLVVLTIVIISGFGSTTRANSSKDQKKKQSNTPQSKQRNVSKSKQRNVPQSKQRDVPQGKQRNVPQGKQRNVPQSKQRNVPQSKQRNVPQSKQRIFNPFKCETVNVPYSRAKSGRTYSFGKGCRTINCFPKCSPVVPPCKQECRTPYKLPWWSKSYRRPAYQPWRFGHQASWSGCHW